MDAPTLTEEGVDLVFTNWRGIVAAPGLTDEETQRYVDAITDDARQRGVAAGRSRTRAGPTPS